MKLKGRSKAVEDLIKAGSSEPQPEAVYAKALPLKLKDNGTKEGFGGEPSVKPKQRSNKEI